jgi:hypothetical protein
MDEVVLGKVCPNQNHHQCKEPTDSDDRASQSGLMLLIIPQIVHLPSTSSSFDNYLSVNMGLMGIWRVSNSS